MEGSRRAQELEKEVESLKSRFAILEERRKDDIEDQKLRQRVGEHHIAPDKGECNRPSHVSP